MYMISCRGRASVTIVIIHDDYVEAEEESEIRGARPAAEDEDYIVYERESNDFVALGDEGFFLLLFASLCG